MSFSMIRVGLFALLVGAGFSSSVSGAVPVPLVNPAPIKTATLTRVKLSAPQVRAAIIAGGAAQAWMLKSEEADHVVLRFEKGRYAVEVRLPYSEEGYRIEYLSSRNLDYQIAELDSRPNVFPEIGVTKPTGPVIHPAYTRWTDALSRSINAFIVGTRAE